MCRRWIWIAVLVPMVAMGYPAMGGGRGLFRVQSVESEGLGMLSLGLHLEGYQQSSGGLTTWYGFLNGGVTYAPLNWLEAFVGPGYREEVTPDGETQFVHGFQDTKTGLKLSFVEIPVVKLGILGFYNFPTLAETFVADVEHGPSYGGKGLFSVNLGDLFHTAPFHFHLNLGYLINNDRIGGNAIKEDELLLAGFGFELPARAFTVGVEATTEQPINISDWAPSDGPIRVTPGIRFTLFPGLSLDLGMDFGLTRATRDWQILAGLGFVSPFLRPGPPQTGVIAGSVRDGLTQEPLSARVEFPDHPMLEGLKTDEAGVFQVDKVPVGVVAVKVSRDDYIPQTTPLVVKVNETTTYEFLLQPTKLYGGLSGTVKDGKTGRPLQAKISFPGAEIEPVVTNQNGFFRIDSIPAGAVAVEASADGYLASTLTVRVEPNRVSTLDFTLRPALVKGAIIGQVTDRKDDHPLAATVSFPETDLPPVRTDPTTGIYQAELPAGSYAAVIHAEGYIDQAAPIVIREDETLERNFQLVKKGMMITLRGIYFDFAKATIKPESYPVLDEAAQILKDNPKIRVEIQGHTDWIGSDEYNQRLSEARAASVVNYFITRHGIGAHRLIAKGYGERVPIATNETDEGRAINRRVEFLVLGVE